MWYYGIIEREKERERKEKERKVEMCSICNLFKGDNLVPTLVVAFASFLVGLLVELVICKATRCNGVVVIC